MESSVHNISKTKKAVIYCRVSSAKQKEEGSGLDTQEHRCRQFAAMNGYEVDAVFPDDVSGGGDYLKRPGMMALLAYIDAQPNETYTVIFDDLKRLARDREFHFKLRSAFRKRGVNVECLNYKFGDTPEDEFMETIFAAQGQLEREQNRRQVMQKMRARVEAGYYLFYPPIGYSYKKLEGGGKVLAPDDLAPIVAEGLKGFATGRFQTASELKRHFDNLPSFPKGSNGEVWIQSVFNMLRQPIYAGYFTIKKWGLHLHPGKHEPLISYSEWQKIQDRLAGNAYAPARADVNTDFPLRGFAECASCGTPLTAAWSKGRTKRYAYYTCFKKGCSEARKSIPKAKIEGAFEGLLGEMKPSPITCRLIRQMFVDCWQMFKTSEGDRRAECKTAISRINAKRTKLLDRILATDSDAVANAIEAELEKLDTEKRILEAQMAEKPKARGGFEETFRTAFDFLSNPQKLWASEHFEHKRMVLRLAFPGRIQYCRNEGVRTAGIAEPFRVLGNFCAGDSNMVELSGIEPLTSCMPCKRSPS